MAWLNALVSYFTPTLTLPHQGGGEEGTLIREEGTLIQWGGKGPLTLPL